MNRTRIAFIVVRCIAAAFAFYAIGRHPYDVYILTRWVVFLTCCWGLWLSRGRIWPSFAPIYVAVGLVFNPFLPLHFSRSIWHTLDIGAGILLLITLAFSATKNDSRREP